MTARRRSFTIGFQTAMGRAFRPAQSAGAERQTAEDRADREALNAAADALERGELETVDHDDLKRRLGLD